MTYADVGRPVDDGSEHPRCRGIRLDSHHLTYQSGERFGAGGLLTPPDCGRLMDVVRSEICQYDSRPDSDRSVTIVNVKTPESSKTTRRVRHSRE